MKTQTKAELREQLAQALAEIRWQTRRRELSDVCIDFWQAEARLTTRRRLMRWLRRWVL